MVWGTRNDLLVQVRGAVLRGVLLGGGTAESVLDFVGSRMAVHGQFGAHAIDVGQGKLGAFEIQLEPAVLSLGVTAQMVFIA